MSQRIPSSAGNYTEYNARRPVNLETSNNSIFGNKTPSTAPSYKIDEYSSRSGQYSNQAPIYSTHIAQLIRQATVGKSTARTLIDAIISITIYISASTILIKTNTITTITQQ
ncbi:hypothetical protein [Paraburkholderia hayleyella]|uniref:hypothetical protein n=1 Tax=Paraburkholderia hayleyella TaxID=2152889 RepID=UPI001291BF8D|nr:hypothetical protein [Paraburkholderia hayleyella]